MRNPSHVPGQPKDVGTSTKSGVFPRVKTAPCTPSVGMTQSFCNANDKFCDSEMSLHALLSYVQAAQFITSKINGSAAVN